MKLLAIFLLVLAAAGAIVLLARRGQDEAPHRPTSAQGKDERSPTDSRRASAPDDSAARTGSEPASLQDLAGSYTHRSDGGLTEHWELFADGRFVYGDSNGAKAEGQAVLEGAALTLTSGHVIRVFLASRDAGGHLTLTRAENDKPRVSNDLATMSPSVSPSARYEKR